MVVLGGGLFLMSEVPLYLTQRYQLGSAVSTFAVRPKLLYKRPRGLRDDSLRPAKSSPEIDH